MDRPARRAARLLFAAAGAAFLADRLTKLWAERSLAEPIEVIRGVLTLRLATNSGGAFSLGTSSPWFFALAAAAVTVVIVATAFRPRPAMQAVALGLILGGAVGNLADRILRGPGVSGHVIDFIDLQVWPIFNVADSAIVIGAILLAWSSFRSERDAA